MQRARQFTRQHLRVEGVTHGDMHVWMLQAWYEVKTRSYMHVSCLLVYGQLIQCLTSLLWMAKIGCIRMVTDVTFSKRLLVHGICRTRGSLLKEVHR